MNSTPRPRRPQPLPLKLAPAIARLNQALAKNPWSEALTESEKTKYFMIRLFGHPPKEVNL